MTDDWGGRATLRAHQAQEAARTARDRAHEVLGFQAVPPPKDGAAGEFAGRVHWAHPLDYLAEACDPHTGKPWLTRDEHDAACQFAELFHRAGIQRQSSTFGAGGGGIEADSTATASARWRAMARKLGDCADLAIEVCCLAKMPSPAQARRLSRGLDRLL